MSRILDEYKVFALKGNVLDMAVGIVVGGAFATIASSFVDNVLAPILGVLTSGVDLKDLFWTLKEGANGGPYATLEDADRDAAVTLGYGVFVNSLISFVIVSWFAFLLVKGLNQLHRRESGRDGKQSKVCPYCFSSLHRKASRCSACTSILEAENS